MGAGESTYVEASKLKGGYRFDNVFCRLPMTVNSQASLSERINMAQLSQVRKDGIFCKWQFIRH